MGLFDKVFKTAPAGDEKFTQQESFAAIALAMAGADGSVSRQEWDGIVTYITRLRIYDNFSGPAFDKEALRVVRLFPKWKPGRHRGKVVAVEYTIPVMFRIP